MQPVTAFMFCFHRVTIYCVPNWHVLLQLFQFSFNIIYFSTEITVYKYTQSSTAMI